MSEWTTTCNERPEWLSRNTAADQTESYCLVIGWSVAEPERMGEVAFVETRGAPIMLGRGGSTVDPGSERLRFFRQRAGTLQATAPLQGAGLSRQQCELRSTPTGISFVNVGRSNTRHNGREAKHGQLETGHVLTIEDQLLLICTRRPSVLPQRHFDLANGGSFGCADRFGIVGESASAWELREQLAFCAATDNHVLILGESGAGKELAARAIHQMSARASRPLVARNAATFPATLIDAELFGNAVNYPNAGMPARPGLIGKVHDSTLLLDEIGELTYDLQAHLLRVLDSGGEYQRLGESQSRRSNFRLLAATNRDPTELRMDVMARFKLQVQLPNLRDRIEDIPLLVRHLLRQMARAKPEWCTRFFAQSDIESEPRIDPDLIEMLVRHSYTYNIRELDGLLWKAVAASHGEYVALTEETHAELAGAVPIASPSANLSSTREVSAQDIVECLNQNDHNVVVAARALGLKSRYALYRLMRKHGIAIERATR